MAERLITKFGGPITITRTTGATFDPVTGDQTGGTTMSMTPMAVRLPLDSGDLAYVEGLRVKASEKILVPVSPLTTFAPAVGDTVTTPDGLFFVRAIDPLKPDSADVLWTLYVER